LHEATELSEIKVLRKSVRETSNQVRVQTLKLNSKLEKPSPRRFTDQKHNDQGFTGNPQKGREAAAPSLIKEIQEVQGGQEAPHNGGPIIPKDA
jgi:hypothetical protein